MIKIKLSDNYYYFLVCSCPSFIFIPIQKAGMRFQEQYYIKVPFSILLHSALLAK